MYNVRERLAAGRLLRREASAEAQELYILPPGIAALLG